MQNLLARLSTVSRDAASAHARLMVVAALTFCAASRLEAASPEARAEKLLSQMLLDEKIGQMTQADLMALKDKGDVRKYFLGSVLSGGGSDPKDGNSPAAWLGAVEEVRGEAL